MKQLRHLTSALVISIFIWVPTQAANAATLDDVVKQIEALQTTVLSKIDAAVKTFRDLMYEKNPTQGKTVAANVAQPDVNESANTSSDALAATKVKEQLTGDSSKFWQQMSELSASDTMQKPSSYSDIFSKKKDEISYDPSFNSNTVLGPETYTPEQEQMAKYFALFNAGFGDPIPKIQLRGLTQKQILDLQANDPDFRKFLVAKRSFITNRSVGLGNIYQLIANRMPQKGLGKKAGLGNKPMSANALQDFLATRRADDAQWYADMAAASPSTIQRETLNVLVEIQKQLQQLHKDNERILLTLSTSQLQGSQINRANMVMVQQSINLTVKRLRKTDAEGSSSISGNEKRAREELAKQKLQEKSESTDQP